MTDELEPLSPLALPAHKPARARHQPTKKADNMPPTSNRIEVTHHTIEQHMDEQNREITDALALAPEVPPTLLRRRTQDEMLRALRLLAGGQARPRDDDSPAVLEDAVYEVASLRQIVADLMQGATNMYQGGLASIRKMTER